MPLQPLSIPRETRSGSLLSPVDYDADAVSIRSDQESDSDDDQLQARARNSRELRAADRMVFLEEDETEKMVTDARKRQASQERRGSNLPIPNPLKYISRRYSDGSASRSPNRPVFDSTDDLVVSEKRRHRRDRRRQKKERLLEEAQDGEDGVLMHEMESGGMKEGSSTGESSDLDDIEEEEHRRRDSKRLLDGKSRRWRGICQCVLILLLVVIAFTILVLLAWRLSTKAPIPKGQQWVSNGTALFAQTTIIISLDGFRADFLNRGLTPRLNAFIKEGVSPLYMLPSFPSVTFPNHYTLATGLYPESHGIVGNTFYDPELKADFYYTDPKRSMDPKWWGGEPFWVTAEKAGIRTAIHMWPGSEAHILHTEPSFLDEYDGKEIMPNKVKRILEFLDKPGMEDPNADVKDMRPQVIAAYVPNVDGDGHTFGPNSTEIRKTIHDADNMLDSIFQGLEARNLTNIVNVVVVSDHGMATTDVSRLTQLDDIIDMNRIEHVDGWPLVGLRPKDPADLEALHRDIIEKTKDIPSLKTYLRDVDMPERYHFSKNDRIAPLWIVPETGWGLVEKKEFDIVQALASGTKYHPIGLHGYDHEHPLMRAIFVARGPAFPHAPGSRVEVFQNTEVYNILCDSVGIEPKPNNGTLRLPLKPVGLHSPEQPIEDPTDPVPSPHPVTTSSHSIGVDPVTVTSQPAHSIQVDPVESPRPTFVKPVHPVQPEKPEKPEIPEKPEKPEQPQQPESGNSKQEGVGGKLSHLWDWVQHKWDELWDKVSSSGRR